MIITQWANYFDILQDKFGSPYFTDAEKSLLFNRALIQYVAEFLPVEEPGSLNVEMDRDSIASLSPLIYELPALNMTSAGIILKSTIQGSLTAQITGGVLWRELALKATLGTDVNPPNYTRHNDWAQFLNNSFKSPTDGNPKYYETALDFRFLPINTITNYVFTVLKYPVSVVIDSVAPSNNVSSDMPDFTHDKIIAIALELAGISSRDEALITLKNTRSPEV